MDDCVSPELVDETSRRRYCESRRDDTASSDRNATASPAGTILHSMFVIG